MADSWYEQKLGPLPIGVWIVLVGGGLAIAFYYNSQHENSQSSRTLVDTSGIPGVGVGAGTPGWVSLEPPEEPNNNPATNEQWAVQAINWLIGQGYEPALADKAIRDYIANVSLSDREYVLVNMALSQFGSPPVPLGPNSQPPTKTPGGMQNVSLDITGVGKTKVSLTWSKVEGTKAYNIVLHGQAGRNFHTLKTVNAPRRNFTWYGLKPNQDYQFRVIAYDHDRNVIARSNYVSVHTEGHDSNNKHHNNSSRNHNEISHRRVRHVTVTKAPSQHGTLWDIAKEMYGHGTAWPVIYNANRDQISNPDLIYPGQTLRIPDLGRPGHLKKGTQKYL